MTERFVTLAPNVMWGTDGSEGVHPGGGMSLAVRGRRALECGMRGLACLETRDAIRRPGVLEVKP